MAWKARRMVGQHVLVGITYVDADDRPIEQCQYHGVIEAVHERQGFTIRVHDRTVEWLPWWVAALSAAPGVIASDPRLVEVPARAVSAREYEARC